MSHRTACVALAAALTLTAGCAGGGAPPEDSGDDSIMHVTARGLTFEAPTEVPSGWTTIRFQNESGMVHFALVERLPGGKGVKEQQDEIAWVFQAGMDQLNAGDVDAATQAFGQVPEWFGDIVFLGGPGLTAPGDISEATIHLEPGTYMLECYVKTDGVFHSYNPDTTAYGMVHEFTVTDEASETEPPTADIEITLSSERGIELSGEVGTGEHVFAVWFEDQKPHENFVGHDVHLARLEDDTDVESLAAWMDWRGATGLQTPAPVEFIGGLNEMPAGSTGYFRATFEPGRYAWVSEVANPAGKSMLQVFTVAP